jgi:hypothetical protein
MLKLIKLSQILEDMDLEEDAEQVKNIIPDSDIDWEQELGQEPETDTSEEDFFGDWANKISDFHKKILKDGKVYEDEPPYLSRYEDSEDFKYLASGTFRDVFEIAGTNFIIKFAKYNHTAAVGANQMEHNNQSAFQGLFPKVYLHGSSAFGTDYDWIVVEKVKVIKNNETFDSFFPVFKSKFPKINVSDIFDAMQSRTPRWVIKSIEDESGLSVKEVIEEAIHDPLFYRIVQASYKIGFELKDIRATNVGIDSDGNFVIIDTLYASLL